MEEGVDLVGGDGAAQAVGSGHSARHVGADGHAGASLVRGDPRAAVRVRYRDAKYPALIDEIPNSVGITTPLAGVRMPRMNAIAERWVKTLHTELLDRALNRQGFGVWRQTRG